MRASKLPGIAFAFQLDFNLRVLLSSAHHIKACNVVQIVIELQEPPQYAANCHLPLGRTTARHALLEASGLVVCKVPHFEWSICTTQDQQQRYLSSLVSSCALASASAPRFSAAPAASVTPASQPQPLSQATITSVAFPTTASAPLNSGAFAFATPLSQGLGTSIFGVSPDASHSSSVFDMGSLDRAL